MKRATTAIIYQDDQILIGQRVRDDLWEFPGGKIDPGETPEECIIREIQEELGLTVRIDRFLCRLQGVYRDIPMDVHGFLICHINGEAAPLVHKAIKWIAPKDLMAHPFIEEDRIIFEYFQKELVS